MLSTITKIPATILETKQPRKETFDIPQEVEITLKEAALYGLQLDRAEVRRDIERAVQMGIFGRIVLSLPADTLSVKAAIAAADKLQPDDTAWVEQESLLELADAANTRKVPSIRILPFTRNGYGRDELGHYYNQHQKDQIKAFNADRAKFDQEHTGFSLEIATVQEIISAWNRHLLKNEDGDQVYDNGWYRTLIEVPGGLVSRRLRVYSYGGQLKLEWDECLGAGTWDSLALSAGEIA
ncbi:MAG: hypothetical protein LBQ02_03515 [Candidatus Nomurabacteria bacterium]|jgi:hypothetical protein|nr:hypothetical protein [Candidatus Nomurabacteria bacterium]